ncbi:thiamine pyrophosphate-binding protein [Streptomyces roseochromogenus]|uniref:Thiamine pyrophosphate-binding protein n=1 Tax=Streptomyces roseochromogenus subsp. oscitans DS 12.976 TaxID=1352936 RepID=V6KNB1_STRRC|nr:thiamine pyrophosphate-binding protein [Streptomyces roseochromogenus]EST32916.1 thiamine pyrophosphate-binding protein [Streptomyces roseochromogenus subsp. oscitans DS 12.976]
MRPVDAMLEVLRDEGVTRVFGNPGTTELPFVEAVTAAPDLEYVLGVQEASVVAMADGYARATGRPAFVSLHIAAGLANGMVGLLNASRSRTPLVVTAGQQDRRHLAQDPMLSGDLVGIARAAVKDTFDVQHAYDLPGMLRRAFALAVQPPAGPVFLSIPMDLLEEETSIDPPPKSRLGGLGPAPGWPEAAERLAAAERPAIVAGDGVGRNGAVADLVAVAEAIGATVYHQPMHDGVDFPTVHPLYAGMLDARYSAIRTALAGHDVVFIAGTRAFMAHHYEPGSPIPDGTAVIQLDDDPGEPGRTFPVALGLVGGVRTTLAALAAQLAGKVPEAPSRVQAIGRVHDATRARVRKRALAGYGDAPMDPLAAVHAVVSGLPADSVVVEEAITSGLLLRSVLPLERPRSYVHTVGGGLGSGIGAAIGSRMGDPTRPVVAVLGDGCTLFGLQGLWSAAHYRVPVTFVVMNNGEYRTLKETAARRGRDRAGRRVGSLDLTPPRLDLTPARDFLGLTDGTPGGPDGLDLAPPELDFSRVAEFFGITAVRARSTDHLAEAVARAAAGDEPVLIDVPITSYAGSA